MKNNIYVIRFKNVDYDETAGIVVIAKDIEDAKKVAEISKEKESYYNTYESNIHSINKIGESELNRKIVLIDFRAG